MTHVTAAALEAGSAHIAESPTEAGTIEMIVRRPDHGEREVVEHAELVVGAGLVGDNYVERGNTRTGGPADPEAQINMMNSRSVDLVAGGDRSRWPLAGDQLFVDLDLSVSNLPTGTRLSLGSAELEVSAKPHTGCAKFSERFGIDAARWVNSSKEIRYRGINLKVVKAGTVRTGDKIAKI